MYEIIVLPHFHGQLKRYAKKYRHIKNDVIEKLRGFDKRQHVYLGNRIYKLRLKSKDIPRGKNKSLRLVILVVEMTSAIVPVILYFKGDREDISKKELKEHLQIILFELELYHDS
ncbi:hypothetical protein KKD19_02950 [Patescibacteria group bacterium]|nr:hypothetical protein [Patescibacteria group bacterium]MBU4512175.1 hypothetical protein [Patescibacteria group bacterium]MCG2692741.1 hypothetical protein [Candidatus Parcubacteria bacterium]